MWFPFLQLTLSNRENSILNMVEMESFMPEAVMGSATVLDVSAA
jgi:hypothetical protein